MEKSCGCSVRIAGQSISISLAMGHALLTCGCGRRAFGNVRRVALIADRQTISVSHSGDSSTTYSADQYFSGAGKTAPEKHF